MSPSRRSLFFCGVLTACLHLVGCNRPNTNQDLSQETRLDQALEALYIYKVESAYEQLSQLQGELPSDDPLWPEATYAYALSAWFQTPTTRDHIEQAVSLLESLVKEEPESEYSLSALLDLGRIAEAIDYRGDVVDLSTARNYYQNVRTLAPESDLATRATLYLAQTYVQTLEEDRIAEAVELLEARIASQTEDAWTPVVAEYLAHLYERYLDQPGAAVDALMVAVKAGLSRPSEADATLWKLGNLAESAGREALAVDLYSRIIRDFPRTVYGTLCRNRIDALTADDDA